jgi:putative flippase GtrA
MKKIKIGMTTSVKNNQFLLYSFCGGCGVFADYTFYYLLLENDLNYNLANILSYFLGTIVSFWLNRGITFSVHDNIAKRFTYFLGVAGFGFIVSAFFLWLFVQSVFIEPVYAKVIVIPIVVFIQFSLNRTFSFAPLSNEKND